MLAAHATRPWSMIYSGLGPVLDIKLLSPALSLFPDCLVTIANKGKKQLNFPPHVLN